jgi:hypothetical protein
MTSQKQDNLYSDKQHVLQNGGDLLLTEINATMIDEMSSITGLINIYMMC